MFHSFFCCRKTLAEKRGFFIYVNMAKDFSKSFYKSRAWQACRDSYIRERMMIDGGLCEICGQNLGVIVHHRVLLTPENINDPDVLLAKDKLCFVCRECHNDIHSTEMHGAGHVLRCTFDADGQPRDKRGKV